MPSALDTPHHHSQQNLDRECAAPGLRAGRVLVTTEVPSQPTAWTKAREDVWGITAGLGYTTLQLPASLSPVAWAGFLRDLAARVSPGGAVLVEYPFEHRKRLYVLALWCRWRGVRLQGLIHDLHALRFGSPAPRELAVLRLFDALIAHNARMSQWLRNGGLDRPIVDLELFDYLVDAPADPEPVTWHEPALAAPLKLVCAGNLSHPKARYIYDPALADLQGVEISLFGAFFEPERMPPSPVVRFKGVFNPARPMLDGRYHFGLVWDGESAQRVAGHYGHYMRYNNPHKVSLYAALGLPVVVWEEAAIAGFVLEQGVGVTVGDLREVADLHRKLQPADYQRMVAHMHRLRARVTEGHFLRRALTALDLRPGHL